MTSVIRQVIATTKLLQYGSIAAGALLAFSPGSLNSSDFRSFKRAAVVEINRASPAYAALEDVRYNYGFEKTESVARVLPAIKIETIKGNVEPIIVAAAEEAEEAVETVRPMRGVTVSFEETLPAPTVIEAAEVLVKNELERRANQTEYRKEIETKYGSNIVVARIEPKKVADEGYTFVPQKRDPFMPSRSIVLAKNDFKPERAPSSNGANDMLVPTTAFKKVAPIGFVGSSDPLDIRGSIRFNGGIAYAPGQDNIHIYQEVDGAAVRQGEFHLSRGYFRINVENLKGRVIAELRNRDGEMFGRGELLIADIAADRIQNKDSVLKVSPLFDGLIGKVLAGASSFKTLPPVENARLTVAGLNREIIMERQNQQYMDKQIRPGSRFMMRAKAPGYWGSIFFGEGGVPFEGRLFSNKIVSALLDLTSSNKFTVRENEEKGIIWGRVVVDGKPLAGAKVELPFETAAKAHYFTGFLPDPNLNVTSENGEFVVTGVKGELQLIKVSANGINYTPIITETAPNHVSLVSFEVQPEREIQMSATEAFTEESRPAFLQIMGGEVVYQIASNGSADKMQLTRGLSLAEVEGGESYRLTRVLLNGYESEISAPLFTNEWASAFGQRLVVGSIEGDDFEVFVGTEEMTGELKVTYIDNNGRATEKKFGEAGGGFVISGLPEGLHTLVIVPAKTKKVVTQLVYVDDHAVHYIKKSVF